jgi:hypothetical protein
MANLRRKAIESLDLVQQENELSYFRLASRLSIVLELVGLVLPVSEHSAKRRFINARHSQSLTQVPGDF